MTKKPIKRVVLRASNPFPRATNLEGYTKFTIPWNDGTGENLYVWIKPDESSQTVYIGSDENLKIQTRQKNLVFKTNTAGVVSAYQSQATLEVIQTNAVYNYRLILSSTSTSVHAAGAELPLTAQLEAKIGDEIIYTRAVEATFTLEESEGFTLQGSTLSVANRGTYIGNQRSCIVSAVVNAPETGEEVFGNLQINQEGNYIEDVEWEGGSFSYDGIGAGATSATPKVTEMTPRFHYTSGQSSAVVPSSTYGTWEVPAVAYSLAKSQNGFTAVNTDTGVLTATHRGTTIGNARASATVSRLKSGTWTPSANFNAKGSKTAEDTLTATCTQAKNVPTAITSVPTFSYAAGALAPYGGTKNVSVSGKVTITWSSGSTSEESTSGDKEGFSVQSTRTYSMVAATGFSISSSTGAVTAATMGTTLGSRSSGNVTSTLKWVLTINDTYGGGELTDSKSSTLTTPVTQGVNERTQVFAKPNILTFTAADIPASGGTVSSGTITYKQLSTWDYTSGATSTGPEYTTGGTITYGDPVSAKSLGTTAKARTEAGILTAKVTLNGQTSAEGEVAVFQAANAITEYGNVSLTVQTPVSCDALGGDYRINPIYSQTIKYTSGSTRAGNVSVTYTQKAAMTGFSLSGNIVTVTENKTTSARNGYTVTVKATGEGSKTASKDVVFNQSLGVKSYATPVITGFTYPTIAAKGGTVTPTITYSQTWGWNDSTTDGGTITTGAALSFTGSKVTSAGSVSAPTKGTTVSGVTTVDTVTLKVTLNNKSVTKAFTVQQAANTATYGNVTISGGTVADIPAKGGSVSSMSGISASQKITYTSGSTRAGTVKITYSTAISGTSLGTTIKNRTKLGTLTATATGEGSKTATKALDVYQAKNVPTSIDAKVARIFSYPNISPSATSAIPNVGGSHVDITYSSGSIQANQIDSNSLLSFTTRYTLSASQNGFTAVKSSNGVLTATNMGTTLGSRVSGTVTKKVVWTCTIPSQYGGGTLTDTVIQTASCTQGVNTATYGDVTLNANNPATVAATGGTATISASASQSVSFTSGASRAGSVSISYTQKAAVSGFSLSGNKVTVTANSTTSTRSYVVTVKATGEGSKTASKDVTVSQAAGARSYSDITLNVSYPIIAAKGGTVTPTVSYSQTWGWNGSTTGGGTITSGGTVTYSGTSVSTSNGAVTAGTKGTNVSGVTTVTTATIKVTLNGKTAQKQVTVQQAANAITSYGAVTISGGTVSDIPAKGGSVSSMSGISASQKITYTSGSTRAGTVKITYSTAISGTSLGTTIKNRTKLGTLTATATGEGSKTATKALDVYQAKNVPTSVSVSAHNYSYPTGAIPAAGGTKTPSASSILIVKFSSGATKAENGGDKEGYTLTSTKTYSMVAATGFSINTSTGVITATNRATTEGAARSCGNTSRKVVWTCTIDSTYGGGTISDSDTKTLTTPVSQAANTLSYSYANPTVTVAAVTDIPASGGTKSSSTVTYKQVRTNSYSSGSSTTTELTSGGTVSWSTAISGSNLGTTAKARTKLGTLTATVTMNGKSGTGSVDVYQQANAITETTYSNPTVSISSVADIPAKGGSVSTGTATYSQTKTDTYTSGSSKPTTITSGGTVKWSTVSASTKGTTVSARTEVDEITCTVTLNSKSGSASKMVYQAANSKNEVSRVITVSVPSGDIPAKGGTKTVTRSGVINYSFTSGATTTSSFTPNLSISGTGFSLSGTTVTAANRSTTVGERRSCTVTASYSGATSKSVTIYQEANAATTITYGTPTVTLKVADIPASGGTVSSGIVTYSQSRTQNYTSGATSALSALTSGGSVSYSSAVSASSLNKTVKDRTKIGILTAIVAMNGKSGSDSADVYQQANTKTTGDITYGNWVISISASNYNSNLRPAPASGGTCTITTSASRTRTQNYSYTSGATSTEALSSETGTPTIQVQGAGLLQSSSDPTKVSWANRGNIVGGARTGIVNATYSGVTKGITLYQEANAQESTIYGTPEVTIESVADIPASGGSVNTGTCSYSQSRTFTYTSGATFDGSPLVRGGTVTWTTVSAESKGTTPSLRTLAGRITCRVTMNGRSGSKTATVYQAANEITSTEIGWKSITNNTEPQSGRGVYSGDTIQIELTTAATSFVGFPIEYLYYHYTSGAEYTEDFSSNVLQSTTMTSNVSFIDTGIGTTTGIVSQNTSTSPRSGTVTCTYKYEDETYTLKFKITQPGVTNHLEVSPTSMSFTASGGTKTLTIDTNESWTIS